MGVGNESGEEPCCEKCEDAALDFEYARPSEGCRTDEEDGQVGICDNEDDY